VQKVELATIFMSLMVKPPVLLPPTCIARHVNE
jgi:hypothetical protein